MGSFLNYLEKEARRIEKEEEKARKDENASNANEFNNKMERLLDLLTNVQKGNIASEKEKAKIENYYQNKKKNIDIEIKKLGEEPNKDKIFKKANKYKLLEKMSSKLKNKRKLLEEECNKQYTEELEKYNDTISEQKKEIEKYNADLDKQEELFKKCDQTEVKKLINLYIESDKISFEIKELQQVNEVKEEIKYRDKELGIDFNFFNPEAFNKIPKRVTYYKTNDEVKYKYFSESELNKIYESYVKKNVLERAYNIFYIFEKQVDSITINCKVNGINPLNGKYEDINIFSVKLNKNDLLEVDIVNIDKTKFLEKHNAKCSSNMLKLEAVTQIGFGNSSPKYEEYTIENIDNDIDGFEFERYSEKILLANGYSNIEVTKSSGDYGADVIAYKDEIKYAIQCKKYTGKVGLSAIQEVIASKSIYNCHVAAVLTNSYFTPNAIELAKKNNVLLWDREKLIDMLNAYKEKYQ